VNNPKRGEVYWVNLDPTTGSEIQKKRPGLVISNDKGNRLGQTIIVIPLTSNTETVRSFEALISSPKQKSKAVCPQIRCIDKRRIEGLAIFRVSSEEMKSVESALKVALDLV